MPTALTVLRLLAIPFFIVWFDDRAVAVAIFVGAVATDALDGILARVLDSRTTVGAVLDPLADKSLFLSSYLLLAARGELPGAWAAIVLVRELAILLGWGLIYLRSGTILLPTRWGKLTNGAQATVVVIYLFRWQERYPAGAAWAGTAMALITLASLVQYARRAWRQWTPLQAA